jgi:hypothetical protein
VGEGEKWGGVRCVVCGVECVCEGGGEGMQLACVSGLSTHVMMTGMTAAAAACTLALESLRHSTSLGIASCQARKRGGGAGYKPGRCLLRRRCGGGAEAARRRRGGGAEGGAEAVDGAVRRLARRHGAGEDSEGRIACVCAASGGAWAGALFGPCSRPRGAGVRQVLFLANEAYQGKGVSQRSPQAANLKQGRAACSVRHVAAQRCRGAEVRVLECLL